MSYEKFEMMDDAIFALMLRDASIPPNPGELVPCLMCGKPMIMPMYIGSPDQVCPECYQDYKDCALLVCAKCGFVIGRVKPGVTDTGFYIKPKMTLHADICGVCDPDITESRVIEMDNWYDKIGKHKKLILPSRLGIQDTGKS